MKALKYIGLLIALAVGAVFAASLVTLITDASPVKKLIAAVALGGLGGGFTLGLIGGERYGLKLPGNSGIDRKFDPGFIGDTFVGLMAGILGTATASRVLKTDLFALPKVDVPSSIPGGAMVELWLLNFSIAYVCGFLGLKLIKNLSERFLQEVQLKEGLERVEHTEGATAFLSGQAAISEKQYIEAQQFFKNALLIDKGNEVRSLVGLARAYRGQKRYLEAIRTLDDAVSRSDREPLKDRMAVVYWNRACYRTLMNQTTLTAQVKDEIFKDLEASLELQPDFRKDLPRDEDLTAIFNDDRFKLLVGKA